MDELQTEAAMVERSRIDRVGRQLFSQGGLVLFMSIMAAAALGWSQELLAAAAARCAGNWAASFLVNNLMVWLFIAWIGAVVAMFGGTAFRKFREWGRQTIEILTWAAWLLTIVAGLVWVGILVPLAIGAIGEMVRQEVVTALLFFQALGLIVALWGAWMLAYVNRDLLAFGSWLRSPLVMAQFSRLSVAPSRSIVFVDRPSSPPAAPPASHDSEEPSRPPPPPSSNADDFY